MGTVPPQARVAPVSRVRREVARTCDRGGVIRPGERILIACSGGADSLTLLDVLARLAPPRGWLVECAHVDHGLRRGSAAEADRVAAVAAARGIVVHRLRADVTQAGSLQDAARRGRYAALEACAHDRGLELIATGHTADDQAETVLMRALTGATPRALAAIRPRSARRVRPLLRLWRVQTQDYCRALGMEPLDDPSNHDPRFLRSHVRHELLPLLEEHFPGARRRLAVLAAHQQRMLDGPDTPANGRQGNERAPC